MTKTKGTITRFDDGTHVFEPYRSSGNRRYEPLLETEFGSLSTTRQQFRIVFRFPRKGGLIAAANHLIAEAARIATLMVSMDVKHNYQ